MAKATATIAKAASKAPAAKPSTTGATLMQQYENAINRGVGQGTEGNPIGDFQAGADAFWDQSSNLRGYADRLRKETRGHEKNMLGMEIKSQQSTARLQASNDNFAARLGLQGTKYQTDGRVKEAEIGARAQQGVARTQAGVQRYQADAGLKSDLAGFASNERVVGMNQAGENYRSGLQLAGSLLMNKEDNYTQRQGKFFDYMGNVANAQWRAPDTNNIRYWS